MKNLFFDYSMKISYSVPVSKCNYTIKCFPVNNARQRVVNETVSLFPESKYCEGVDGLGNMQIYGVNEEDHKTFLFRISGCVQTGLCDYEELGNDNRDMIFRHPHGLNIAGPAIQAFYEEMKPEITKKQGKYQQALAMMHKLNAAFHYQKCCTDVDTTAEEAFCQRQGVCQDYAHIFIALLHLHGIGARYVTGLIVGEGASHAWVEVLCDGRWYGLDPTNDTVVSEEHIKIGIGRDAKDCMINRGIMHGGGLHTQTVKVRVREI